MHSQVLYFECLLLAQIHGYLPKFESHGLNLLYLELVLRDFFNVRNELGIYLNGALRKHFSMTNVPFHFESPILLGP